MPNIIYQITNKVNGKMYVGKTTKSAEERFRRHIINHKTGKTYLYSAMRKHGVENFVVSVLEEDVEVIDDRERFWIAKLSPQYNMTEGGDGGDTSSSPNFKRSIKESHENRDRSSYATRGMLGKKQSQKFFDSIKKSNRCPVVCEGRTFASVGEAQEHYPGIHVRKRLDNPKYPEFYRLRERTLRKDQKVLEASTAIQ